MLRVKKLVSSPSASRMQKCMAASGDEGSSAFANRGSNTSGEDGSVCLASPKRHCYNGSATRDRDGSVCLAPSSAQNNATTTNVNPTEIGPAQMGSSAPTRN